MLELSKEKYIQTIEDLLELKENEDLCLDYSATDTLDKAIRLIEEAVPQMADEYRIRHCVHIGDKQVVFGENTIPAELPAEDRLPFLVSDAKPFYELDIIEYSNSVVGDDYLEMMRTFLERIEEQIKSTELGREKLGIPNEPFLAKHIVPQSHCGEYS